MKVNTTTGTMPFSKIAKLQKDKKIYLDESFQSNARWDVASSQSYMTSVFLGRAVTSIILADIKSIVASLRLAFGEDNDDYKFFKNLEGQGYEYITVDGNNRSRCINAFAEGNFPLTEQEYEIDDGYVPVFKANMSNKYYDSLPSDIQTYLNATKMNVLLVTQCDRVGLAALFIAVNKGMNLNAQEKRNAILCAFGAYVRKLASDKKLAKTFVEIYGQRGVNRRYSDEMIVTAAVIVARGIDNITNAARDLAYTDTSEELSVFSSRVKPLITTIVENLVKAKGTGILEVGGMQSANFTDLIILLNYMQQNKIVIEDHSAFYDWFLLSQSERVANPDILYEGSKGTNKRTYAGLMRATSKAFLTIRQNMLIKSLGECPDDILTFRDTERNFDPKLRYFFWKRQEGICPLKNIYIEPRFIWDGSVTHIDHDIPWSKEGETSIENGQLVFADANLAKSNMIFEEVPEL
jgi:hypothetical protein|tara:strand:- start:463 stop:1857 length:1395 start_codon:yes stop_codon:yes gene_type:complete